MSEEFNPHKEGNRIYGLPKEAKEEALIGALKRCNSDSEKADLLYFACYPPEEELIITKTSSRYRIGGEEFWVEDEEREIVFP